MYAAMGFNASPKEIADWGEYWQTAIVVEYETWSDPKVREYQEKRQRQAEAEREKAKAKEKEARGESRRRAGDNHLAPVKRS